MHFFKKIQVWILKSQGIRKWILRFFTIQINPRCIRESWCILIREELALITDELSKPFMFSLASVNDLLYWHDRFNNRRKIVQSFLRKIGSFIQSHCVRFFRIYCNFLLTV